MQTITRRSFPESVITALSILVVVGLIAYALGQEQQRREADPANVNLTFDTGRASFQAGTYFIPYVVSNDSSHAIDSADMLIEVLDGEEVVESSAISLVSLPLDGRQNGIYASRHDPATHQIRGRLTSLVFP
ncbi:MAG: hypothetical protein M3Z20_11025 [Chloroflexota bacterium]|nr:hypothetical protein [Chloroflexota bacterium]